MQSSRVGFRKEQQLKVDRDDVVASFAGYRSQRVREQNHWKGSLNLTADDWSPGQNYNTALGRVYDPDGVGFADVYHIQLSALGNRRAHGPLGALSPYRTEYVREPYSLTLHGKFDRSGVNAGTVAVYPKGNASTHEYVAWPDPTNFWAYDRTTAGAFDRMQAGSVMWTEELRRCMELALTHWVLWDTLPELIERKDESES